MRLAGKGELQINVTSTLDSRPIAEARISILLYRGAGTDIGAGDNGFIRTE